MPSLLTVEHLIKIFPGSAKPSVNDISFSLNEGEVLGILGPNGAGKTTTIQMILGTLTVTSGSISYFGKNFSRHRSEILKHVGFATTYVRLPELLTVEENLKFFGYLSGLSNPQPQVNEMIDMFNLKHIKNEKAGSLSTGQLARVMLAKAFLARPRIVILDEPTASLDPDISHSIRHLIVHMKQEYKTSIVFTSHNMEEVTEVCDRVIVFKQGQLIADGTPAHLASTVSKAKVQLVITQGIETLRSFAQQKHLVITFKDRFIEIEVEESEIAQLLTQLASLGIHYSHISIEKPTLEDYFLRIAQI